MKFSVLVLLAVVFGCAVALPEDNYELQRICWEPSCKQRLAPVVIPTGGPPLVYEQTDSSAAYPFYMNPSTLAAGFPNNFRDESRRNAILGRDDTDHYVLAWNHTGKSTNHYINVQLLIMATTRTENVEVNIAAFSNAGFPAAAEDHKLVNASLAAAAYPEILPGERLIGSVSLSTRNRPINYIVSEQNNVPYWTFTDYTSGCAATPPFGFPSFGFPYNLDNCNLTFGMRLNRALVELPTIGYVRFVVWETKGRPTPMIFGTGSYSLINYVLANSGALPPMMAAPFVYANQAERDLANQNYGRLLDLGARTSDAFDVSRSFDLLTPGSKKR